jgi:hypothetical protein
MTYAPVRETHANLDGILPNDTRYALLEGGCTVKIFFMP